MFKTPKLTWLILALVAVTSVVLVACGSGTDERTAPAPAAVAQDQPGGDIDTETLNALVAAAVAKALKAEAQLAPQQVATEMDQPAAAIENAMAEPAQTEIAPVEEPATRPAERMAAVETEPERQAETTVSADAPSDAYGIVAAHEDVLASIYDAVLPSVVRIEVASSVAGGQTPQGQLPDGFQQRGEGSGFVWSQDGYIVTNHHVVDDADRVTIVFADGTEVEGEVLGSDPDSDLAVLKVDLPAEQLKPVALGDSSALRVGQLAVAIGTPFGQDFTMTRGIVSALGRTIPGNGAFSIPESIQTDAPINPGNSGGPLLDKDGRVIGINSQIRTLSGSSSGVGFAVPINAARRVIPELIEHGTYEYAYLGITGADLRSTAAEAKGLSEDTHGVIVMEVHDGGPSARAGVKANTGTTTFGGDQYPVGGDVITAVDGVAVDEMGDLISYMNENTRPGDTMASSLVRSDGSQATVDIELTARPTVSPPTAFVP